MISKNQTSAGQIEGSVMSHENKDVIRETSATSAGKVYI